MLYPSDGLPLPLSLESPVPRIANDAYMTPPALALAICKYLSEAAPAPEALKRLQKEGMSGTEFLALPFPVVPRLILEPSCGSGNFIAAARQVWPEARIAGYDLRDVPQIAGSVLRRVDFLQTFAGGWDLIIGNPPYSFAAEHVEHARKLLAPEGRLVFLLRINFLGSTKRVEWFKAHQPVSVTPIAPRPSFIDGRNDATEYAIFEWDAPDSFTSRIRAHNRPTIDARGRASDLWPTLTWANSSSDE